MGSMPYQMVHEPNKNRNPYATNDRVYLAPNKESQYEDSRGRYEDSRGRYDDSRGRYEDSRGRYDDSRGRYEDSRGRYDDSRGRYDDTMVANSRYDDTGSDIYVTSGAYKGNHKAPSEISRTSKPRPPSRYSYRSGVAPSVASRTSTVRTGKTSRKGGVTIETMAAPNPFCPNIKGMCCLMLLINLGIILVTLGFVIVIQFFEPVFVWVLGIVFLTFGFLTLIGSLIYCVVICREIKSPKDVNLDELYWTHHWSKTIGSAPADIHYKSETEKYLDDRYSDKCSLAKYSDKGKYSDREKDRVEKRTPKFAGSIEKIISKACQETEIYLKHNIDGIMIENMHDIPYIQSKHFGPEISVSMTRICTEIRKIVPKEVPCGVQILSSGNKEALAVAKVCSLDFIRAEGYVFAHIGDEGFTDACAGDLLRYRKSIEAENVMIFADIKKKHSSHAITSDLSLDETAKAAEFFMADGLILTGVSTGDPANPQELNKLKQSTSLPILIGSGVTEQNLENYMDADGLIVGSHFKIEGKWFNSVDEKRVRGFCVKLKELRESIAT